MDVMKRILITVSVTFMNCYDPPPDKLQCKAAKSNNKNMVTALSVMPDTPQEIRDNFYLMYLLNIHIQKKHCHKGMN